MAQADLELMILLLQPLSAVNARKHVTPGLAKNLYFYQVSPGEADIAMLGLTLWIISLLSPSQVPS
jgi:hypothetical protein